MANRLSTEKEQKMNKDQSPGGKPGNREFITTDADAFVNELDISPLDTEIVREVKEQLAEIEDDDSNIIFIFTEGKYVVTGIHVHPAALDGETGPILMRGSTENLIIAAFSRDYVAELLKETDLVGDFEEDTPGLPSGITEGMSARDRAWVSRLESMAKLVRLELSSNPPERWEEMLGGGI